MERIGCPSFAFEFVLLEETIKEVNKLCIKRASQTLDISVKIIKENKDLISYFVYYIQIFFLDISLYFQNLH